MLVVIKLNVSYEDKHTSIGNLASTFDTGSCTEETEDGVLDLIGVVQEQHRGDDVEDVPVGVLLGNLTLGHGHGSRAGSHGTDESKSENGVLHLERFDVKWSFRG